MGAEARPCRVWGLPAASTARGVGRGPATQLEVGRGRPLCRRQPTKHVVAPLQGCAAAHATRAAHLTASSRRGRPAAPRVPSTVSRGTRRETSDRFRDGRWVCGSALPFMDGTSFLRLPSRGDRRPCRRPLKCRPPPACCVFLLIRS